MLIICVCLLYVYAYYVYVLIICICLLNMCMLIIGSASSMEALSTPNDTTHTSIPAASSTFDMGAMVNVESIIILPRSELDRANKDKRHYPDEFQVTNIIILIFLEVHRYDLFTGISITDMNKIYNQ